MIYWLADVMDEMPLGDEGISPSFLSTTEETVYRGLRFAKRRRDWLLGRRTAKQLLRRSVIAYSNLPLTEITVANDPDGAPYYCVNGQRLSFCLSISHREGRALCALSGTHTIGADVERIEPRAPAFVEDFFTDRENELVHAASPADRDLLITLIWSAKESVLKVLRQGLRIDTTRIEICDKDLQNFSSNIKETHNVLWHPLYVDCLMSAAPPLVAWWRLDGNDVLTLAAAIPARSHERLAICAV